MRDIEETSGIPNGTMLSHDTSTILYRHLRTREGDEPTPETLLPPDACRPRPPPPPRPLSGPLHPDPHAAQSPHQDHPVRASHPPRRGRAAPRDAHAPRRVPSASDPCSSATPPYR